MVILLGLSWANYQSLVSNNKLWSVQHWNGAISAESIWVCTITTGKINSYQHPLLDIYLWMIYNLVNRTNPARIKNPLYRVGLFPSQVSQSYAEGFLSMKDIFKLIKELVLLSLPMILLGLWLLYITIKEF